MLEILSRVQVPFHTSQVPTVIPAAKMGRGEYVTCGSTGGVNYWAIGGIMSISTPAWNGPYQVVFGSFRRKTALTPNGPGILT